MAAISTVTTQSNKVPVMQTPEEFHFFAKFLLSLRCALVHALDSSHEAILESCLVYGSKSSPSYDGAEIICGSLDL